MKQIIGSALIVVGGIWESISSCGVIVFGFLFWLGVLLWLATSTWGGIIWALLWLFIGGGLTAMLVDLASLPSRFFGVCLMVLGARLKDFESEAVDVARLAYCTTCGSQRISEVDQYCRICGAPYG